MHEPAYNPSVVPDITRSAPLTARHQQAPRPRRDPYDGLRPWSAITHGTGAVLALVGTAFLLVRAAGLEDWIKFSAFLVYGLSMIGLYTASTLYHCVNTTVRGRLALRKYDHCSIYLLIAGSYTPICLTALRHSGGEAEPVHALTLGPLRIDPARHQVLAHGREVTLTLKEFQLLSLLVEHAGTVFTRDQLLNTIWGYEFDGASRTVDVHVRTLRQKLGEAGRCIETVRGVGYKAESDPSKSEEQP